MYARKSHQKKEEAGSPSVGRKKDFPLLPKPEVSKRVIMFLCSAGWGIA